jgi:tRNA threonylcarbamoyladenosine biosynthesis protein TsaE
VEISVDSEENLKQVAQKIIEFAGDHKIWLFVGEMGSGKTTLIKRICEEYNVEDNVSSPSYQIINEYQTGDEKRILHFDFYRVKNPVEAMNLGVDELFESGDLCMVEWPDQVMTLLPEKYLNIRIDVVSETQRKIFLNQNGG